jgi:adenine deaminase
VSALTPGKIITDREHAELPYRQGQRHADPSRDLLKICGLERHGRNGNVGHGFVRTQTKTRVFVSLLTVW